jgi:hypothetical protein
MCKIPERKPSTKPERIFKLDRDGRQLLNWPALCDLPELNHYEIKTKCFEKLPFCEQVELVYWADIIVSNHGSGLAMNAFARKGSVVMGILQ